MSDKATETPSKEYEAYDPDSGRRLLFWRIEERQVVPLEELTNDELIEHTKRLRIRALTETLTNGDSIANECVKFLGLEVERRGLAIPD